MKELKIVIDANILVSAYSANGRIREQWKHGFGPHQLVISPEIFVEVERTLRQAEFHLSPDQIKHCLKDILARCVLVRPKTRFDGEVPDEKDRHLANLALEVKADRIITGETALRTGSPIAGIRVVKLAEFAEEISTRG
jgi:putative PIN family toxin of toxin-antitoxin system